MLLVFKSMQGFFAYLWRAFLNLLVLNFKRFEGLAPVRNQANNDLKKKYFWLQTKIFFAERRKA